MPEPGDSRKENGAVLPEFVMLTGTRGRRKADEADMTPPYLKRSYGIGLLGFMDAPILQCDAILPDTQLK
jgi:hypothetical protein